MRSFSPLRYPGGKAKFYNNIVDYFNKNNIKEKIYVEPFAGGCGLSLLLLENNIVDKLILNDIDKGIYAFWQSVLLYNKEFCSLVEMSVINLEERNRQKSIYDNKNNIDIFNKKQLLDLGFSTFYLNRVNRSGIIKGGVIGGVSQSGKYKMDCRFNKPNLIKRIEKIGNLKNKIQFFNLDVLDFLDILPQKDVFIYFDPPYYRKGKDLYTNFYNHLDHVKLANKIFKLPQNWIITYDNVDEIREIYSDFKIIEFDINYTLAKNRKAKEFLICKDNYK